MAIDVLANDADGNSDLLTIAVLGVTGGTASVVGNQVVFKSTAPFLGTATVTYRVDDGHGGTAQATALIDVTPGPDRAFVINAFQKLTDLAPAAADLDRWLVQLDQGGSRLDVVRDMMNHPGFDEKLLAGLAADIGFQPASGQLAQAQSLLDGGAPLDTVRQRLLSSPQFFKRRARRNNQRFVKAVFQALQGTNGKARERRRLVDQLTRGGSRQKVVRRIAGALASKLLLADQTYQTWLGRPATAEEATALAQSLQGGKGEADAIAELVAAE